MPSSAASRRGTASRTVSRKRNSDEANIDDNVSPHRVRPANGRESRRRRAVVNEESDSEGEEQQQQQQEEETFVEANERHSESEESEDEEEKQDHADETIIERSLIISSSDEEDDEEEEEEEEGEKEKAVVVEQPVRRARVVSTAEHQRILSSSSAPSRVKEEEPAPVDLIDTARQDQLPSSSSSAPRTPERKAVRIQSAFVTPDRSSAAPRTPTSGGMRAVTPATTLKTPAATIVQPPKTRLIIHKMVLRNFKSYAGEQIIGPFHKSFSAVVGPNGSGKSNVIDAMLFVFGWRANKMRQGKLSELIHNSAGKENIGSCTVEVHFRDIVDLPGEEYTLVPRSKLVVARTAYRNNTSIYTMNAKKSSFTEVTTLLKERGIDLDHKRFLILQGEVESIAQMPPKAKNEHEEGLLEYLEDIIGTSSYKTPIEEAAKKVEELNEVRTERLSRLKIVQKEKDSLESKRREAVGYLRDQNDLTTRQSALYQIYMLDASNEIKIATSSIEKLKLRIEEETEKNAGSKSEMETLDAEYKQINKEYEGLVKETEKLSKELAKLEKDDVQLQEQRKHLETKRKKLTKTMNDEKHASSEARATLENATEEIANHAKEVGKLEDSLDKEEAELEKVREALKGKTQGFSEAIEKKQKELQPWSMKRNEKQNQKKVAMEEKRLLDERFGQAEKDADQAKASLDALQEAQEGKQGEIQMLKDEKVQQAKKVKQYKEELLGMEATETEMRSKANASRAKFEEAKASVQSNQSRGEVLNSLMRQVDLGMIKGLNGRLGSLGVIDERYDVAISTACPGLENIVVEGVETGQACIEHLRRNNLGRANFILLNSLAKMNLGAISTPENVPRLFDLVKPKDARFAPAFYHQLRDTLVAKDLQQANRIAYGAQRWRVVTLDGQLIDKSGTMSGGGTRVARGAMSSKAFAQDYTLEQISRLERERQVDQETLNSHLKSTTEMRSLLDAAAAKIPRIDVDLDKVQLDIATGAKMIAEAQRRVGQLQTQHGPDAGDLKRAAELSKSVEKMEAELAELEQKCAAIEADIASLQEKILEAGGVGLRAQKSKVDGIKERIELFGERITKAEVAKNKAEKDLVKLTKSTGKNEEAFKSLEEELEQALAASSGKADKVADLRKQVDDGQFAVEAKQEAKDEIKTKLDKCMEGINAFRALEMEIRQKLEDSESSLTENGKRMKHWQEKHAKLELHRIDDDDDDDDEEGQVDAEKEPAREKIADAENEEQAEENAMAEASAIQQHSRSVELQEHSPDELRAMSKDTLKSEIGVFEEKLQKGSANLSVLEEYRKRENEFLARAHDLEQTTKQRDQAKEVHDNLRKERLESFMHGFGIISAKLKEMYQTITLGGNAELELVDSLDPFSEGILFSVMPPKKSWKNISNLSGGEKTLSSLALVFALHAFKPTPLYAMDELDAALDFRNVSIVANLIKERTKGAQFIVISLRNNMFELASRLVGIYKTCGQTKSLAVHNTDLHAPPPQVTAARQTSVSRASQQPMATPRGSVPPRTYGTTPGPGTSHRFGSIPPSSTHRAGLLMTTPSTVRKTALMPSSVTTGHLASSQAAMGPPLATPARFNIIPQTPRTGNIRGLGMASTASSSIKLTSSQSIRGNLALAGNSDRNTFAPSTPLAMRRQLPN